MIKYYSVNHPEKSHGGDLAKIKAEWGERLKQVEKFKVEKGKKGVLTKRETFALKEDEDDASPSKPRKSK